MVSSMYFKDLIAKFSKFTLIIPINTYQNALEWNGYEQSHYLFMTYIAVLEFVIINMLKAYPTLLYKQI